MKRLNMRILILGIASVPCCVGFCIGLWAHTIEVVDGPNSGDGINEYFGFRAGKIDARQAIETCSLGETNKSHYILSRITGETLYGDRVEDITYNHLPASHRPDHRSHRSASAPMLPWQDTLVR